MQISCCYNDIKPVTTGSLTVTKTSVSANTTMSIGFSLILSI